MEDDSTDGIRRAELALNLGADEAMRGLFKRADQPVKTVEAWWAFAKEFWQQLTFAATMLGGAFAWLWSHVAVVADHGWAAITLACIFGIPTVFLIVVWSIIGAAEISGWLKKRHSEPDRSGLATEQDQEPNAGSIRLEPNTIAALQTELNKNAHESDGRLRNLERDLSMVANVLQWELSIGILADALKLSSPEYPVTLLGISDAAAREVTEKGKAYIKAVMQMVTPGPYEQEISFAWQDGQARGADYATSLAGPDRPTNLDPYVFLEMMRALYAAVALRKALERYYEDGRLNSRSHRARAQEIIDRYSKSR